MKTLLSAVMAAMLALYTIEATGGDGASAEQPVPLVIEANTLAQALDEWARQTGYQIFVPNWELAKSLPAPALKGSFNPRAALEKLLEGTSFTWVPVKEKAVLVREKMRAEPPPEPDRPKGKPPPMQLAPERSGSSRDLPEEVVVTAQKRAQILEEVPISISVLSGAQLDRANVSGIGEVLNTVPGVASTEHYAGGSLVTVRGVAAGSPVFDGSSPIAYYLDSVPFGFVRTAVAPDANAYDMQRVEVLRGPQGTLYGATALNGVVRVLTADANLDEFEFKARTSASSTEDGGASYRADVAVNIPIVPDRLAARAVVGYGDLSGWIDRPNEDDANDSELRTARLKINGQLTERLSVGLSSWFSRNDYGAPPTSGDGKTNASLVAEPNAVDYDVYGLKLVYALPAVTITSSTSGIDYRNVSDLDFTPVGFPATLTTDLRSEVFAQELILSSNADGPWRWSLGGFYRDAEDRSSQILFAEAVSDFVDTSESVALFGEITRVFADGRFELTGGLRYFEDDVSVEDELSDSAVPRNSDTFDAASPRVVLAWHPGDELTAYLSFAQGFRSGVLQTPGALSQAPDFAPAEADTLRNYEVGVKGNALDGRLRYEAAVYYVDWEGVQQSITVGTLGFNAVVNGESASGMGVDLALTAQPVDALQLGANVSWNDLTTDSVVQSGGFDLIPPGDRLNRSPARTAGASASYEFPMGGSGLTGQLAASASYISEQITRTVFGGPSSGTSGDVTVGRVSFAVDATRWGAVLFVDNVNDERDATVAPPFRAPDWNSHVRPRTVGVQLEYRF